MRAIFKKRSGFRARINRSCPWSTTPSPAAVFFRAKTFQETFEASEYKTSAAVICPVQTKPLL